MNTICVLSPFVAIGLFLYGKLHNPSVKVGPHRCADARDNFRATLSALGLLLLSAFAVFYVLVPDSEGKRWSPWLGIPAALLIALLGLLKLYLRWREHRIASPGTLVASEWPLVPGRTVELAFERAMHAHVSGSVDLHASLSLFEASRLYTTRWTRRTSMALRSASPPLVDGVVRVRRGYFATSGTIMIWPRSSAVRPLPSVMSQSDGCRTSCA